MHNRHNKRSYMYTVGPTYNEFDYNDHLAKANKFYAYKL